MIINQMFIWIKFQKCDLIHILRFFVQKIDFDFYNCDLDHIFYLVFTL